MSGVGRVPSAAACFAASLLGGRRVLARPRGPAFCAFAVGRLVPAVFRHVVRPALWPHFGGSDGRVVTFAKIEKEKVYTYRYI